MKLYYEPTIGLLRRLALFLFLCLACGSVHPERRVALSIGNSASKAFRRSRTR